MSATIDDALELLEDTGPEFAGGLSNHGPMAAEAMFALGRPDAVIPWVERYKGRLHERPDARHPIDRVLWREALGDGGRVGDWVAFFDRELAEAPWPTAVGEWVPCLAPGIIAAATHGVIRTAHAVRALALEETPRRRHELAEGLGYWAARYSVLPGRMHAAAARSLPSEAISKVAPLPRDDQASFGLITEGLARLDGYAPFEEAINLVDASGEPSRFVSDLTETFARVYLANSGGRHLIGFIHGVTGPSAVRLLAPYLTPDTTAEALRYAWQAGAAIYAAFGQPGAIAAPVEAPDISADDLIDRAVATHDEHAIKFTEACLREYALKPSPAYLAAAYDTTQRLQRRS